MQQLTYIAKIKNLDEVERDLDKVGLACSKLWNVALYHSRQVWERKGKIPHAFKVQEEVQSHYWYKHLPSHTAQAVLQELWQAYKSWFSQRRNGNYGARPPGYCKRKGRVLMNTVTFKRSGFKLEGTRLRLSRGETVTAEIGEKYLYLDLALPPVADISNPKLVRLVHREGRWEVHLVCDVPCADEAPGEGVAAIDVGIVNLAAIAYSDDTTGLYSGRGLLAQEYYFVREIAKCKPSRWKPGSRKRAASKRERKLQRKRSGRRKQFLHAISRDIVNMGIEKGIGTIVLGDLSGIRWQSNGEARNHGRASNLKLHAWPFDRFAQMLAYKANLSGITIVKVSERNTSRRCSACGCRDGNSRIHRGLLVCSECGAVINADVNGAINLLRKYLQGLDLSTGVSVRVGELPTIWPEPSVNRYDWGKPNPFPAGILEEVRVAGSA